MMKEKGHRTAILEGEFDFDDDMIEIKSDITIEGRGAAIKNGGFEISGERNIIIRGITFKRYQGKSQELDHIRVTSDAKHVWIDDCTFEGTRDGCVDIKRSARYVTVSNCIFGKEAHKIMLIAMSHW